MENLQNQIEALDHKIDMIVAYYFLDEENYPVQSLKMAVDTLITHPDLDKHLPPNTLDMLLSDMKHVKTVIRLMIEKGELKKKLFRL